MRGVNRLLIGSFLVALSISVVAVPASFAQANGPLNFGQNYIVRGDFVVAGAQGLNTSFGADGNGTGTIKIPDANPGITGVNAVPADAEVIAAVLYWQTVEKVGAGPGGLGSGENGFFRPVFAGGPAKGYPITGVPLPGNNESVTWSSGGCSEPQGGRITRTYRANVVTLLPRNANGTISANGTYEVRLPNVGNNTPLTLGATLVLIYRRFDPSVSLNAIVIYDGSFGQSEDSPVMTQTMQGFYDAANTPVSRIAYIAAGGKINKFQTVKLDGVTLPSLYGNAEPPFPGYYGTWDNPTWTFPSPGILANFKNPVDAGDASAETQVTPTTSNGGCVSWGAVIVATTVQNTDGDGLLDVWKAPKAPYSKLRPGYCDAAVNQGLCIQGGPNWVDLPGAVLGTSASPHPDIYVQYDYMCSSPNSDGNTCKTGDGTNYSFSPTLQTDPVDGKNAMQKVQAVYALHGITLHVNAEANPPNQLNVHAIQEQSCQDTVVKGKESLCIWPNPPGTTINRGVVAWPGGVNGFEQELIFAAAPTNVADLTYCANSPLPLGCVPRFQPAAAPSKHYGLFAHAVGQPKWSMYNGTLVTVTQTGTMVTFTTSTPVGALNVLGKDAITGKTVDDPSCTYGRVTVVGASTNQNLNGTFCVNSFNTAGDTFTITLGSSTNASPSYTVSTDPNLAVVPPYTSSASGIADVGGHHFVVSLGLWGNPAFSGVSPATSPESDGQKPAVIASTLMHEQGHAIFTLAHGGPAAKALENNPALYESVNTNCKVNYLSVMSYSRQLDVLDYSESALPDIDKATQSGSFSLTDTDITHWYVPFPAAKDSKGDPIGSPAALLCTGVPPPAGEIPMTEVTALANTFSWSSLSGTNTDINFDGSLYPHTAENFLGACDWCVGSYDLAQTDATGSYLSSSGPPFGGGGPPFGGGGPPFGGGGPPFGGGGPPFGGGGPPFGGGGPPFGGGGPPFGGGGEIDVATANSVTHVPQNLKVTSEGVSPRTVALSWTAPFGQIGSYNVYRSPNGANNFTLINSVPAPTTTYTDTVACNTGGYQYFVTAVLANTNPPQESTPSNTASTILPDTTDHVTACYNVTNFTVPASGVQGSQVSPISWTLQDDFYSTGGAVTLKTANTLVAIGPLPGTCNAPVSGRTALVTNGTPAYAGDTFTNSGDVFTFTWNSTDSFCAGSYTFELDLDHVGANPAQVVTAATALQLAIDVGDTNSTPHVTTVALTTGTVGLAYSDTLTEDGGTAPFKWTFTGSFPTGSIGQSAPNSPTISGTPCSAGGFNLVAMVTDSAAKPNSGTQALTLQILQASTSTLVASSLNPSTYGQPVTFTATVVPQYGCTPTGKVTFYDGNAAISGAITLSNSATASFMTTAVQLGAGPHSITAVYGGDANFTGSTSPILSQTVNKAFTTTSVMSLLNPSTYGQAVTFVATVAPQYAGTPSGSVTFYDGMTPISTPISLSSASAMFTTTTLQLGAGPNSIMAKYNDDSNFYATGLGGSTAVVLPQSVSQATTTTSVTSSPSSPSTYGQAVTFNATVAPQYTGTPTGTVTFQDSGVALAGSSTVTLSGGTASFTTADTALTVGSHSITAVYSGDTNFYATNAGGSTAQALPQTVNPASLIATVTGTESTEPPTFGVSSVSYSGFAGMDGSSVVNGTLSCAVVVPSGGGTAGSNPISCTGLSAQNYNISYDFSHLASIAAATPAPLTVNVVGSVQTVGGPPAFTLASYTFTGFVASNTSPPVTGTLSCSPLVLKDSSGNYPISCSGLTATGYNISYSYSYGPSNAATPTPLTVAVNGTVQTGGTPAFTVNSLTYSGFVNTDTISVVNGTLACSLGTGVSNSYPITCLGLTAGNYNVSYDFSASTGVSPVSPSPLIVTVTGAPPSVTYAVSGLVNGDSPMAVGGALTCTAGTKDGAGNTPISCAGLSATNYLITYSYSYSSALDAANNQATLTVNVIGTVPQGAGYNPPPPLTITSVTYSGFVNDDTASGVTGTLSCTTKAGPNALTLYVISGCSGLTAPGYYTINYWFGKVTVVAPPPHP